MSGQIKLKAATLGGDITLSPTDTASNLVVTIPAGTSTLVTNATLPAQLNATGSAPIYACRAWVNFNGTGTVAIRESGNVSSITDNGTGTYVVNLTTSLQDANGAPAGSAIPGTAGTGNNNRNVYAAQITTNQIRVNITENNVNTFADSEFISVAIFR
jgi:hypothetical protein